MSSKHRFDFYVQDWRTSRIRTHSIMTGERDLRLLYLEVLFALHEHGGSLPADPSDLWSILGLPEEVVARHLPTLLRFGEVCRGGLRLEGDRIVNGRLAEDLERDLAYRQAQAELGRAGGIRSAEVRRERFGTARPLGSRAGFVYFLRSGEAVKIGFSTRPAERLAALADSLPGGGEVIGCVPGSEEDELAVHERFSALRLNGEWFRADAELLSYVAGAVASVTDRRVPFAGSPNGRSGPEGSPKPTTPSPYPSTLPPTEGESKGAAGAAEGGSAPAPPPGPPGGTDDDPGPKKPKTEAQRVREQELAWRVRECWSAYLGQRRLFYAEVNGKEAPREPTLTPEIRKAILEAVQTYDHGLLGPEDRERWRRESKARAAGIGLFFDPWMTAEKEGNRMGHDEGARYYLEPWRPWKRQRGKPDPVERFSALQFEELGR